MEIISVLVVIVVAIVAYWWYNSIVPVSMTNNQIGATSKPFSNQERFYPRFTDERGASANLVLAYKDVGGYNISDPHFQEVLKDIYTVQLGKCVIFTGNTYKFSSPRMEEIHLEYVREIIASEIEQEKNKSQFFFTNENLYSAYKALEDLKSSDAIVDKKQKSLLEIKYQKALGEWGAVRPGALRIKDGRYVWKDHEWEQIWVDYRIDRELSENDNSDLSEDVSSPIEVSGKITCGNVEDEPAAVELVKEIGKLIATLKQQLGL